VRRGGAFKPRAFHKRIGGAYLKDGDHELLVGAETILDRLPDGIVLGEHQVGLLVTAVVHQAKVAVVADVEQGVVLAQDVGHVIVVRGRDQLLKLLAGEDIDGDEMALGVTVLASLGGGHVRDLAGTVFDADVSTLADGSRLLGEGERGTRLAGLELLLVKVVIISHFGMRFEG